MPASPHAEKDDMAKYEDRIELLEFATRKDDRLSAMPHQHFEDSDDPWDTINRIDTIEGIQEHYRRSSFDVLLGDDKIKKLAKYEGASGKHLFDVVHRIIVMRRLTGDYAELERIAKEMYKPEWYAQIVMEDIPEEEGDMASRSSSKVRKQIHEMYDENGPLKRTISDLGKDVFVHMLADDDERDLLEYYSNRIEQKLKKEKDAKPIEPSPPDFGKADSSFSINSEPNTGPLVPLISTMNATKNGTKPPFGQGVLNLKDAKPADLERVGNTSGAPAGRLVRRDVDGMGVSITVKTSGDAEISVSVKA